MQEGSLFSTPYPIFIVCRFFIFIIIFFLMMAILASVRWCLSVILMCISLIINDAEQLFMCLLAICMSSLQKCLFKSARFCTGMCGFLALILCNSLDINSLLDVSFANIFSIQWAAFHFAEFPSLCKSLLVCCGPMCLFLLLFPLIWTVGRRGSCCDLCQRVFPYVFL